MALKITMEAKTKDKDDNEKTSSLTLYCTKEEGEISTDINIEYEGTVITVPASRLKSSIDLLHIDHIVR